MRLPLVSRRRHELLAGSLRFEREQVRAERDVAQRANRRLTRELAQTRAHVRQLERAIEEHRSGAPAPPDEDLWAALDGHDLCEDPGCPAREANPHRVGFCRQARAHLEADGG